MRDRQGRRARKGWGAAGLRKPQGDWPEGSAAGVAGHLVQRALGLAQAIWNKARTHKV